MRRAQYARFARARPTPPNTLRLVLLLRAVDARDDSVITVVRLERELLLRLALLLLQLVDLASENDLRGRRRVNAVRLDRHDEPAAVLEEHVRVQRNNAGLIRLRDIAEDDVDHADEHAVAVRLAGIVNDRDNVRALLRHVRELATRAVRELDGVDNALRADHIGNMGDGRAAGTTQVEHLAARLDRHVADTANNGGAQLRAERIPDAVLLLLLLVLGRDALLAIDRLTRSHVLGDESIILAPH